MSGLDVTDIIESHTATARHTTRQLLNGRAKGVLYDRRQHPMDPHLRPKRHARVRASGNGHTDAKTSTSTSELAAEVVYQAETAAEHDHVDTGSLDIAIMEILDQLSASDDDDDGDVDADAAESRCSTSHKIESKHVHGSGGRSTGQRKAQASVSEGPQRISGVEKYLASLDQTDVEVSRSAGHDDTNTDSDDDGQTRFFTPEA